MSDTPRTDAVLNTFDGVASKLAADLATHAESLERKVDSLREELARRHKEYASALNRRVDVENALAMVAAGKREMLTREQCRELANKLGEGEA